jgi:sigma-B regulation protein RsbU (phosphoserine phosphatase)
VDLEGDAMALLEFVKGTNQGTKLELVGDRIVFGRNADCHVVLNQAPVSREHAVIRKLDGKYYIEDMNSRNKTFVNGKEVKMRTPLKNEDEIKICENVMTFYEAPPKEAIPLHMRKNAKDEEEEEDNSTVEATIQSHSSKQILEAQPSERLALLLEISTELTQTMSTEELLPKIVEKLFTVFRQADRAFIILKEDDKLIGKVIKTRRQGEDDKTRFSRKIVNLCIEKGQAILSEDASSDTKFDLSQSIADCKIRSMVCAPLLSRGSGLAFGVIQLDTQDRFKKFTQDDLRLLIAVAAQAAAAIENAKMHESLVIAAELGRDLQLAHRVQIGFLPKKLPQVPGYDFYACYKSAQEVGGDYYDFIPLPNNRFGVMIGDVAGKGIPAALLMAKVSSDARFCTLTEPSLVEAIGKLNEQMQEAGLLDRFVTFGACVLDLHQHSMTVVNAGHIPPLIYRAATKTFEQGCTKDQTGFPLGILEGIPYDCNTVTLNVGDCVVLITDGISESKNREEKDFGMEGLLSCLNPGPMNPKSMGERLLDAVNKHAIGRKPHDDLTVVTFGRMS